MKNIKNYEDFISEEINLKKAITTGALAAGMALSNPIYSQSNTIDSSKVDSSIVKNVISEGYTEDQVEELLGKPCSISFFNKGKDGRLESLKGWENISDINDNNINLWKEIYLLSTYQVWYYNYYIPSKDSTLTEEEIKSMPYMIETKNSFKVYFKKKYSYGSFQNYVFLASFASCDFNDIGKYPYIIKDNQELKTLILK